MLLLAAACAGEWVLIDRDLRFLEHAVQDQGEVQRLFVRGGGRGQTRHAGIGFEADGQPRQENTLLGLLCRPSTGPVPILRQPGPGGGVRIDDWRCRAQALDGALLGAGIGAAALGAFLFRRFRARSDERPAVSS